jgi:hypothetical protein
LDCHVLEQLKTLLFFLEVDIFDLFGCWGFFREVLTIHTEWPNHLSIEFFTEYGIILKTRLYFEVLLAFLSHISEHEHAIGDFFLEKGDFLFDAVPNGALPFSVVLFFLLIRHFNNI